MVKRISMLIHKLRNPTKVGYDPMPALSGGEYYLEIGTKGLRYGYEFKVSRADLEVLAAALHEFLDNTRPIGDGIYQWFDKPEGEEALAEWEIELLRDKAAQLRDEEAE